MRIIITISDKYQFTWSASLVTSYFRFNVPLTTFIFAKSNTDNDIQGQQAITIGPSQQILDIASRTIYWEFVVCIKNTVTCYLSMGYYMSGFYECASLQGYIHSNKYSIIITYWYFKYIKKITPILLVKHRNYVRQFIFNTLDYSIIREMNGQIKFRKRYFYLLTNLSWTIPNYRKLI